MRRCVLIRPASWRAGEPISAERALWEQALQGQRLGAALKTALSPENLAELRAYAATLPEVVENR